MAVRLADAVIRRMAQKMREQALVVSSDRDVAGACLAAGAAAIPCSEFAQRIMEALSGKEEDDPAPEPRSTAKKGPSRRAPKQSRRTRRKAGKL